VITIELFIISFEVYFLGYTIIIPYLTSHFPTFSKQVKQFCDLNDKPPYNLSTEEFNITIEE